MIENNLLVAIIIGVCLGLSFLFSGMESGVMGLDRLRIRQAARSGNKRAVVLNEFLKDPEGFLWTILVGNTLTNFLIICVGLYELHRWLAQHRVWLMVCFGIGTFIFYIVCELLPKSLFQRYPTRLSLLLARPFRFIHKGLTPLVSVVDWFAGRLMRWTGGKAFTGQLFGGRDELRLMMQESTLGLTSDEKRMINRVLDLQKIRVRNVTMPLANVVCVPDQATVADVLALSREKHFTRFPVTEASTGRILGLINAQELMLLKIADSSRTVRDFVQPALFLKENTALEDALRRMQRDGSRMAVVLDAAHQEVGVISLQDILRAIFGEVTL